MEYTHQYQQHSQLPNQKGRQIIYGQKEQERDSAFLESFQNKKAHYMTEDKQFSQINSNYSPSNYNHFKQQSQNFRQIDENQRVKEAYSDSIRKKKFMPYSNQNIESTNNVNDIEKSDNMQLGQRHYYQDHSIQKLNQSIDIQKHNNNNYQNDSFQRQKTLEHSSNSPVKLPSLVQHLYNSVNQYSKNQPATRYSQDTLKERHERQKEIKQRLYQVMAPQESFYEQYNGFYHQNDYSLNVNDDLVKKRLLLENNSQESQSQNNHTFSNYIKSNIQDGYQNNQKQYDVLQNQSNSTNDHTPVFIKSNYQKAGSNQIQGLDSIRDEGDQVSTRYSQINEMKKFNIRKKLGLSTDKKDGYSTNIPSSIASSKISCLQNNPSYSFIDHVNSQLLQMKLNQQQYMSPSKNQNQNNSFLQNDQNSQQKKKRSITQDGRNNSPKFSQKIQEEYEQDQNIQNIKNYFNRKYNQNTVQPDGKYYPRYDYSEFRVQSELEDKHINDQKPQLKQLRQRSSRSLLQDPQLKKKRDSNTFSFQNSQTEKFHAQQHKQNSQINPIEALQNIITEAANGPPVIRRSSKKAPKNYIEQEDDNEDIILDINVKGNSYINKNNQNSSNLIVDNKRKSRDFQDNDELFSYKQYYSQEKQSQQNEQENSDFLNNARLYSKQSNQNQVVNQKNRDQDQFQLDSTFNLQKELEKDQ